MKSDCLNCKTRIDLNGLLSTRLVQWVPAGFNFQRFLQINQTAKWTGSQILRSDRLVQSKSDSHEKIR